MAGIWKSVTESLGVRKRLDRVEVKRAFIQMGVEVFFLLSFFHIILNPFQFFLIDQLTSRDDNANAHF